VGPRAGWDGCRKSHPHQDLIPGLSFLETVQYNNVIRIFMQSFLPLHKCCYNKSKIRESKRHNVYEGKKKNIISGGNE
jgi:hypothetical protein